MAGVGVVLQGRCRSRKAQDELVERLSQVEDVGEKALDSKQGDQGISYDGRVSYKQVILAGTLFEGEKHPEHLRRLADYAFLAEEVSLFGRKFSLCGSKVFSEQDWEGAVGDLSLVFIRSGDPFLDGRLVLPQGINPQHPFRTVGQILLDNPSFAIPRQAQDWVTECLAWVRRAYLPNLRCWMDGKLLREEYQTEHVHQETQEVEAQFAALRKAFAEGRGNRGAQHREAAAL